VPPEPAPLAGTRVLVIGASGFLGTRLVERLVLERGARVRALVRSVAGATRIARFPIEVVLGDVLDPRAVAAAAEGCAVVFNCAKGTGRDAARRRATDVDGARHVVEAAHRAGARVVHVSTLAVYDLPRDGDADERTPDAPPGDPYADGKLAGERLALEHGARLGVPVAVVQPTVVYGPYSTIHGSEILGELRASRMIVVNGGSGVCNAVYVDDAVTGLLLAATAERAAGERFLISGPEHPTWRDFFGAFERMLGVERTVSLSEAKALALWRRSRRRGWLAAETMRALKTDRALRKRLLATREGAAARWLAERIVPKALSAAEERAQSWSQSANLSSEAEPPITPLRPWLVAYLAKCARVRIDKARELLGYEPRFGLDAGMRLTERWAQWAGLLG
jgi:nucleoside-diphosphate-sugar epimerase